MTRSRSQIPPEFLFIGLKRSSSALIGSCALSGVRASPSRLAVVAPWVRAAPFVLIQAACAFVLLTGWSWTAVSVAVGLYIVRMFAITGFYHRYFSHRTFKTSRAFQFIMAWVGASSAQRGPIWWAAHHRHHHLESDTEEDIHSPRHKGFMMSHCGWFLTERGFYAPSVYTRDWNRFPELVWIDRFCLVPPLSLMVALGLFGWAAATWWGFDIGSLTLSAAIQGEPLQLGSFHFNYGGPLQ